MVVDIEWIDKNGIFGIEEYSEPWSEGEGKWV